MMKVRSARVSLGSHDQYRPHDVLPQRGRPAGCGKQQARAAGHSILSISYSCPLVGLKLNAQARISEVYSALCHGARGVQLTSCLG